MRAALALSKAGLKVAVLSKVFPHARTPWQHSGGIAASLGNIDEDNWHWHMYDTVKGSDYLGDQDAHRVYVPQRGRRWCMSWNTSHAIQQAGQWQDLPAPFGAGICRTMAKTTVPRACAAADRTGHACAAHAVISRTLRPYEFLHRVDGAGFDPR